MERTDTARGAHAPRASTTLAIAAGLLVASALTTWATVSFGAPAVRLSDPVLRGASTPAGPVLWAGALIAAVCVALAARGRMPGGLAGAAGAVVLAVTGFVAAGRSGMADAGIRLAADRVAGTTGLPAAALADRLRALAGDGGVAVRLDLGVWLAVAGGVALLAGGILAWRQARRAATAVTSTAAPSGSEEQPTAALA